MGHPRYTWEDDLPAESHAGETSASREKTTKPRWKIFSTSKSSASPAEAKSQGPSARLFWPEAYLLDDVPEARVWTYGYNADVISGLFQANNTNSISQHGRDLAVKLDREIDNEVAIDLPSQRPRQADKTRTQSYS